MKNLYILIIFLAISNTLAGQIYNPFLSATDATFISPKSPWGPVNTFGTATFTVGNQAGGQSMNHWDECADALACKLQILISPTVGFMEFGPTIIGGAAPSGTMASRFDWFYFSGTLTGIQKADIDAGESGTITFPIKFTAISTEATNSPCNGQSNCYGTQVGGNYKGRNGVVVNLTPPTQPLNNNQNATDDNIGGYEYTLTRLPLNNLTFQAKPLSDRKVELNWSTLTEQNNREFEVERYDADNKSWNTIGKKLAVGFSTKKSEYVYIDKPGDIKESKIYYRLKSVETNGAFQYTDVRMVTFDGHHGITLNTFPNPFIQSFYLDMNLKKEGPVEIQIFDVLGRQVFNETNIIPKGYTSKLIQLEQVPQGTYSVHVSYEGTQQVLKTLKIN